MMAIKVKVQKDYLKTETSYEPTTPVEEIHKMLKATRTSGKMVVLYYDGSVQGINTEQNAKMSLSKSEKVRSLLSIRDEEL